MLFYPVESTHHAADCCSRVACEVNTGGNKDIRVNSAWKMVLKVKRPELFYCKGEGEKNGTK